MNGIVMTPSNESYLKKEKPVNEIDTLMDLDPLELSSQDIDRIIEYQRKARANFEAGVKPKKGEAVKIDLVKLGLVKAPEPFKRRF